MSAARSAVWVAFFVLAMPLLTWMKGRLPRIAVGETNGALPARAYPVHEHAVAAEVEVGAARLPQPQGSQVGARQDVSAQVELADRRVFDLSEAGCQPGARGRRRGSDRDEVDLMHEPGIAFGLDRLEGPGSQVMTQRRLAQGPGDERRRPRRGGGVLGGGLPVGSLDR